MEKSREPMLLVSPSYLTWWVGPPTGLGWIAASLLKIRSEPRIIDCRVTKNYRKVIVEEVKRYSSVGISSNIGTISGALEIASLIRKLSPGTRIIFGGPQSTAIYDKIIPRYADIVVLGEGEGAVTEIMQQKDLSRIDGIAYWDGLLKVNPRRSFIEDLDSLGMPAWHLFDLMKYKFSFGRLPSAVITTSRGCPNQCIYCSESVHGQKIRMRSLENVLKEIDYLIENFGVREINIGDDNFTLHPERVKQFCRMIIARNYRKHPYFSIPIGIRPDKGDLEMFKMMEEAGFYRASMGVDSGSPEVLNKIKRKQNLEKIEETLGMLNKTNIKVKLNFIIGLPFDTPQTMRQTIDLSKRLLARNRSVLGVLFSKGTPLPGTEFFRLVQDRGKFLCDPVFNSVDFYGKAAFELGDLKADDIDRMFSRANRELFFSFPFILRALTIKFELREIPVILKYLWFKVFRSQFKIKEKVVPKKQLNYAADIFNNRPCN